MSATFDPGPGWREVNHEEWVRMYPSGGLRLTETGGDRYWVREAPEPPLPTAPYTVIRVTWNEDEGARNIVRIQAPQESMWQTLTSGPVKYWGSETLHALISGFEVLSEPRWVTAAEIMEDFETHHWDTSAETVDAIFRNYGVVS